MVIRLGIVGFGWVARDYMWPAIQSQPGVELTAVVSPLQQDFNGLPLTVATYSTLEQMLIGSELDAVYVASPNHLHHDHAVSCLRAGLHVLCEKPLARNLAEAENMVSVAAYSNRLLITAYDQRYHPAHQLMQRLVAEGGIGNLTQARIDYACWLPAGWSKDNWRVDPERAGGGAVIDLAPHGLDLLETISGQTISDLHCFGQAVVQEYAVDDGGVLSARLSQGMLAAITVGYNRPDNLARRRLEITGTNGMLVARNTMGQVAGGELALHSIDGEIKNLAFDLQRGPFYGLLESFLATVRGERTEERNARSDLRLVGLLGKALTKMMP